MGRFGSRYASLCETVGKVQKNHGWYHGHCRALMERAQAVPFAQHSSGIMLEGAVFAERQ